MNIVYAVQDQDGDILGIYEEKVDATERFEELMDEGYEGVTVSDYILNADVKLFDLTNVVPFGTAQ